MVGLEKEVLEICWMDVVILYKVPELPLCKPPSCCSSAKLCFRLSFREAGKEAVYWVRSVSVCYRTVLSVRHEGQLACQCNRNSGPT